MFPLQVYEVTQYSTSMDVESADEGSFSIEQWMLSQDVSDRDETLDEDAARMLCLHRTLDVGYDSHELAVAMADLDPDAISKIADRIKSEEPRFAVIVLVNMLEILAADRMSTEGDQRYMRALRRVLGKLDFLVNEICEKAKQKDICPDTLHYFLVFISFITRANEGLSPEEVTDVIRVVANPAFVKIVLRVWKFPEMIDHIPGTDEADRLKGLGAIATIFLESVIRGALRNAACEENVNIVRVSRESLSNIVSLGRWFVAFWNLRMYSADMSLSERGRLIDVLLMLLSYDPVFVREYVFADFKFMRTVCHSLILIDFRGVSDLVQNAGELDDSELADSFVAELESELKHMIRSAVGIHLHVKLLHAAIATVDASEASSIKSQDILHSQWFWDAMQHLAQFAESIVDMVDRELFHVSACKLPCSMNYFASILWRVGTLIVSSILSEGTQRPSPKELRILGRRYFHISNSVSSLPFFSCKMHCFRYLSRQLLQLHDLVTHPKTEVRSERALCDFCLSLHVEEPSQPKVCGRCLQAHFCDDEHLRMHWRKFHKRGCRLLSMLNEVRCSGAEALGPVPHMDENLDELLDIPWLNDALKVNGTEWFCQKYGSLVQSLGCGFVVRVSANGDETVDILSHGNIIREEYNCLIQEGKLNKLAILQSVCELIRNPDSKVCLVRRSFAEQRVENRENNASAVDSDGYIGLYSTSSVVCMIEDCTECMIRNFNMPCVYR